VLLQVLSGLEASQKQREAALQEGWAALHAQAAALQVQSSPAPYKELQA
jgi:hypothetical protein